MSQFLDTAPGNLDEAAGGSVKWLTTGEAAELCGVAPDTVLRWIKKGKLQAERTPGGHHRIPAAAVERLVVPREEGRPGEHAARKPLYCWEYFSRNADPSPECQRCIVYRSRAQWCFRLVSNAVCLHSKRYLRTSCEECPYYRRIHRLPANVLVITADPELIGALKREATDSVHCQFAANAYEASAAVERFQPEFAVVDCSLPNGDPRELMACLANDGRAPGLRVILAVRSLTGVPRRCSASKDLLVAVLRKPFGAEAIRAIIDRIPVPDPPPVEESVPAS